MAIEAKIDELIAALDRNTAARSAGKTEPAKEPAKAAAKTPAALIAETAAKPAPEVQAKAAEPAKALTYDDVKVPFLALVKKNRDLALATLKPFGLDSLKPAKPEQFAAILAALNNALAS